MAFVGLHMDNAKDNGTMETIWIIGLIQYILVYYSVLY